ncbi:hypothetical protein L7E35_004665 [Vibrio parahaemolyticus]|nr:hypothetical protein [Vibrio parahaemolyticus]EIV1599719.1 hypothetical protein [Vibrio parahaemolyticus]
MRIAEEGFYYYTIKNNRGKINTKSDRKREYIKDYESLEIKSDSIIFKDKNLEEESIFFISYNLGMFEIPFKKISVLVDHVYHQVVIVYLNNGLLIYVPDVDLSKDKYSSKGFFIEFDLEIFKNDYEQQIKANEEECSIRIERYLDNPPMFFWLWDVYREHRVSFKLNEFVYHLISKEIDVINKYKNEMKLALLSNGYLKKYSNLADEIFDEYEMDSLKLSRNRYRELEKTIKFDFYEKEIEPVDIIQKEMKNRFRKLKNKMFPLYLMEDGKVLDYYLSDVSDFEDDDGILLKDYVLDHLGSGDYLSIV